MNRCLGLVAIVCLVGCGDCGGPAVKKDVLASYDVQAKGIYANCALPPFPVTYAFVGVLSRLKDGGVSIALGEDVFPSTFDGQFVSFGATTSTSSPLVDGGTCNACQLKLAQKGTLAFLSPSQGSALGDVCPVSALDGGIPAANEDAGIALPVVQPDGGLDAVRVCGELYIDITGEGFCDQACYACKLIYRLSGERQK
jgi:hypothetical protein